MLVDRELAGRVRYGDHFQQFSTDAVDDPVRLLDHLSQRALSYLRNYASRKRVVVKPLHGRNETLGHDSGVTRRVARDVGANLPHVIHRWLRPDNPRHSI